MTKKPIVTLINVTKDALDMLILAKSTRLEMTPNLLSDIQDMTYEKKKEEAEYIANTIPSSWEFVDFIFLIQNVTRAFTHQFVRSRHASYAQQTMRVLDVGGWTYATGPTIDDRPVLHRFVIGQVDPHELQTAKGVYDECMGNIARDYNDLVASGVAIEDARGVLPTNIHTNILVKLNLRALAELVHKRSSSRVQGEYRDILKQLKSTSIEQLPWVKLFVERTFDKAADELDELIQKLPTKKLDEVGSWSDIDKTKMIKLLDQMRMKS